MLRPKRHAALVAALDEAVAADPSLAGPRSLLLTPLTQLDALARDAPGALGDDVIAAERLRLLLALAASQLPALATIRQVVGHDAGGGHGAAPATPCDESIVDLGALVVVALAAGRVGKSTGLADPMVNNVLGLAIAAGPAEALARALSGGMSPPQVAALLGGLAARENGPDRRLPAVIAAFLADPCERARWAALERLFARVRSDVAQHTWDAAGPGSIAAVEPRAACPGQPITLRVQPGTGAEPGGDGSPALDGAYFLPLLARRAASVVFASQGRRPVARLPESVDPQAGTVTVVVPAGARVGWLGFSDPELVRRSNQDRAAVRAAWSERNESDAALRESPVPVAQIPLLRSPSTPPRTPAARFDGGAPVVLEASLAPKVVDPGAPLRLSWRAQGASAVRVEPRPGRVEAEGSLTLPAPENRARVSLDLVAESPCGAPVRRQLRARVRVRIRRVEVGQPERAPAVALSVVAESDGGVERLGRGLVRVNLPGARASRVADAVPLVAGEPTVVSALLSAPDARGRADLLVEGAAFPMKLEAGRATATLPGSLAVDGLRGTLSFRGPDGQVEDRSEFGPVRFVALRTRPLVVVRPALLGGGLRRVSPAERDAAIAEARIRLALEVQVDEPAWIDDEDLAFDDLADGRDVPVTRAILERLNALAARTPGLEDRLWVALVPAAEGREFHRLEPAEGARAVAVCTPGRLDEVLDTELPDPEPRTTRLRVVGRVEPDGTIRLQPLRVEERAAGPGAPHPTTLRLVGLDRRGRARVVQPVRLLQEERPARLVALLPVTDEVVDLEIRAPRSEAVTLVDLLRGEDGPGHDLVHRVHRSEGRPEILEARADGDSLHFDYRHARSARATTVVEVGGARGWSPVLRLAPCDDAATLPVDRLAVGEGDRVRVVATDGWNTAAGPDEGLALPRLPVERVAARHAGASRFWADLDRPDDAELRWSFGEETRTGPLVTAPAGYHGPVVLHVVRDGQVVASDTRRIRADGRVDDRATLVPESPCHA